MTRPLLPPDTNAFIALRREALLDTPLAFDASPEDDRALQTDSVLELLSSPSKHCAIGAFEDDVLVGIAVLNRDQGRKAHHRGNVWGVFVTSGARGKGHARAMMLALLETARVWGLCQVELAVSSRTPDAKHVYERVGFRVWGSLPNALVWEGETMTKIFMVLEL